MDEFKHEGTGPDGGNTTHTNTLLRKECLAVIRSPGPWLAVGGFRMTRH